MSTPVRPALAAAAAAMLAAAASPALAQTYGSQGYGSQGYGSQGYNQPYGGSTARSGYGAQNYPPSTYDRGSSQGYGASPSSQYPSNTRAPDYGGAERYGQPNRYDQGQGGDQGDDPEALARQLNLSPSQRQAYDAYQRAFQPDEARMRQEEDDMRRAASLTTPQRLDQARAAMDRDRADFERTAAATRAFYAQLSPAQRRTFDQITAPQPDDGQDGPDGQGGPSPTQPTARQPR